MPQPTASDLQSHREPRLWSQPACLQILPFPFTSSVTSSLADSQFHTHKVEIIIGIVRVRTRSLKSTGHLQSTWHVPSAVSSSYESFFYIPIIPLIMLDPGEKSDKPKSALLQLSPVLSHPEAKERHPLESCPRSSIRNTSVRPNEAIN